MVVEEDDEDDEDIELGKKDIITIKLFFKYLLILY